MKFKLQKNCPLGMLNFSYIFLHFLHPFSIIHQIITLEKEFHCLRQRLEVRRTRKAGKFFSSSSSASSTSSSSFLLSEEADDLKEKKEKCKEKFIAISISWHFIVRKSFTSFRESFLFWLITFLCGFSNENKKWLFLYY